MPEEFVMETNVLRPLDINSSEAPKRAHHLMTQQLKHLFSLENLEQDPCIVFSMDSDLSVPFQLIANLESVKRISRDKRLVKECLTPAFLTYNSQTNSIQPHIVVPRTKVSLRTSKLKEELVETFDFQYKKFYQDTMRTWILEFDSEESSIQACQKLDELGFNCGIETEFPFTYLINKVKERMSEIPTSPFFNFIKFKEREGKKFSLCEIEQRFVRIEPNSGILKLMKFLCPLIRESPNMTLETMKVD